MKLGCGRPINRHGQCEAWTIKSLLADNAERFGRTGNNTRKILHETFRFWLQGTKCPSQDNFNSLLDSLKPQLDVEPFRTKHERAFTQLVLAYDDWKNLRDQPRPQPAGAAAPRASLEADATPPRLAAWSLDEDFRRVFEKHALFCGRRRILGEIASWYDREIVKYGEKRPGQPMLLITGDPGIGKTALMAHITKNLPRGFVICHQFCDHTIAETLKPGRFVLNLASSLDRNRDLEEYRDQLHRTTSVLSDDTIKRYVDESEEDPRALFNRFFISPLKDAHPAKIGWIIIDGLDEALEIDGRPGPVRSVVHLFARELDLLPDWVRVLATCRREVPELLGAPSEPGGRIKLLPIKDYWEEQDAREYIDQRLDGDTARRLPESTVRNLISDTAGNFLLLSLRLNKFLNSDTDVENDRIPNDLAAFYSQDFERRFPFKTEQWRHFDTEVQPLLAVAMANGEPSISPEFLRRATGLEQRRLVLALREIRDYFPLRDGKYAVFHKSFFDWVNGPLGGDYYTDTAEGHRKLAAFCAGILTRMRKEWPVRVENNDDARSYALKHGTTHLVEAGYFAEAIHILDFIVREVIPKAQHFLPPATASRLRSPAVATRAVLLALDQADDDADPFAFTLARSDDAGNLPALSAAGKPQNNWRPLCRLLKLFYQVEPLHGVIRRLFLRHYPDEWPAILADLVEAENYVLTHEIAMVLGDACSESKVPISSIYEYLENPSDIDHYELGGYALHRFLGREPDRIGQSLQQLASLANCPVYVGPSILGEIVLNRALQDWRFVSEIRGAPFRKFWGREPMWDHVRQEIWDIEAAAMWGAGREPLTGADCGLRAAYDHLIATEHLRSHIAENDVVAREATIAALVERKTYWSLGNNPNPIGDARDALRNLPMPLLGQVIRLFFAHPLWEVGETAASVLASITVEVPHTLEILSEFLDTSKNQHWRVRLGAIEAAHCRPHLDPEARDDLFYRAVVDFFNDAHSGVRALCAENLVALIIEHAPASRKLLLKRFRDQLLYWFNEERDCWVLEHLFRLRKALENSYDWQKLFPLKSSSLLAGLTDWSDRKNFLAHIERRKLRGDG
jgi:hypothetical protein